MEGWCGCECVWAASKDCGYIDGRWWCIGVLVWVNGVVIGWVITAIDSDGM
jgi:hypothetical protein